MLAIHLQLQRPSLKHITGFVSLLMILLASLAWRSALRPRVWATTEVPVAFWAWRINAPTIAEVEIAQRAAQAQTLFLRAGQIHYEAKSPHRIRTVRGNLSFPLTLHLVYNATKSLLTEFERVDPVALASVICEAYLQDAERARRDGASVAGLQLDIDVPTRLLPRYTRLLQAVRERLPPSTKLSITGLPTWMESSALGDALTVVDFWIPQCYGLTIPERLNQLVAISSPSTIARTIAQARRLGRPFYAGLAAYGYAILYSNDGSLVALRGDMNPVNFARHPNFALIERHAFNAPFISAEDSAAALMPVVGEWRYVYQAREEGVVDGLAVHAGDFLVLHVLSAEGLRQSARAVREQAGDQFLGICVFRLPSSVDPATLTIRQVAAALANAPTEVAVSVKVEPPTAQSTDAQDTARHLNIKVINQGTASAVLGDDALHVELRVPAGSIRAVANVEGFSSLETLCTAPEADDPFAPGSLNPCSPRRANVLRFAATAWMPESTAQAAISFDSDQSQRIPVTVTVQTDDGRTWRREMLSEVWREHRTELRQDVTQ